MCKTKKIVSFFFVALFVSYYANAVFFPHWHIIDGEAIAHSHMHADSHHDTNSGNHTQHCITLIAQNSHFEYIDFLCNCALKPLQLSINENQFVETTHWIASIYLENISLRAPPVV